ncbi:hypothetical protein UFOVP4_20 [uncultured Caudovirales phage]|uniref:Uncharacterized protein n=1 Tax=uncultured Caudovirales phage TaxID=2100421 RepID=A0A6J5TAT2_9CAUD|nr:hypothetical protein UFOVP4_20 [uncultured Caudovirales phage]CAB4241309.1 hypothetical protein UFOVP64_39 [uncultured Caudovirales phage]CAB5079012.1 hypothetical protein UFOVP145_53 [uncultured Caudovirales phage]
MEPKMPPEEPIAREVIIIDASNGDEILYQEVHTNPEEL